MKKVILSLVMVATLSFVSCKEETTETPVVEEAIEEVVAPVEATVDTMATVVDSAVAPVVAPAK
jgi:hypothetical protein